MKKALKAVLAAALLSTATSAWATPSTAFWTPATTYVQPYLVPHLTYDTYFGEPSALPIDTGITIGVLPFEKLQAEIGFDLNYPGRTQNGFYLNAKIGVPEGALGEGFPGLSVGVQNVGFKKDVNNYDLFHGEVGKTLPFGTIALGGYYGVTKALMLNPTTQKAQQAGFMGAYTTPDLTLNLPALNKINFTLDGMSGKNSFGAVGGCVGFYFTPAIDVLAGPVFFLNKDAQPGAASWLWSVQLDVDTDFFAKAK
jgi:hypothetical protein